MPASAILARFTVYKPKSPSPLKHSFVPRCELPSSSDFEDLFEAPINSHSAMDILTDLTVLDGANDVDPSSPTAQQSTRDSAVDGLAPFSFSDDEDDPCPDLSMDVDISSSSSSNSPSPPESSSESFGGDAPFGASSEPPYDGASQAELDLFLDAITSWNVPSPSPSSQPIIIEPTSGGSVGGKRKREDEVSAFGSDRSRPSPFPFDQQPFYAIPRSAYLKLPSYKRLRVASPSTSSETPLASSPPIYPKHMPYPSASSSSSSFYLPSRDDPLPTRAPIPRIQVTPPPDDDDDDTPTEAEAQDDEDDYETYFPIDVDPLPEAVPPEASSSSSSTFPTDFYAGLEALNDTVSVGRPSSSSSSSSLSSPSSSSMSSSSSSSRRGSGGSRSGTARSGNLNGGRRRQMGMRGWTTLTSSWGSSSLDEGA